MRTRYSHFKIRSLRAKGLTWAQIAEAMGCCENTVRRALTDDIDAFNKKENARKKRYRERLRNAVKN